MNLKQILNLNGNDICGLDIGTSAVKIVALHKDDAGYKVTAAGISQITDRRSSTPGQESENGTIDTNIIKAIRDCFTSVRQKAPNKLRTKLAVCGISGPEIAVRDFEFPPLPEEEIAGAVSIEAGLVCPFNPEQAAVDYQLISNGDNKIKGVLVAATNTLIKNKVRFTKEAGLRCVLMDVDGLALLNCLNGLVGGQERAGTVILNVGASHSTLAIMSEGGWPFIRDTNFAGDEIIRQMTAGNNTPQETLKQMLFGDRPDSQTELGDSLEQACAELISDVSETLRFYATQKKSIHVKKIFVCGGFSLAKGFVELLSHRLGIEACLWNPFDSELCRISDQDKDFFRKAGPAMAVATGLAMRSINTGREKKHE